MMSKVLLIFFVVISWYVAGMVHSFALMLYAVCLTFFMLAMHFVTSIYKKRVSFAFASDYASAVEGRDYLVRVNINNNHGLPVSKIRLDIEVSYGFNGNKTKYMLTKKIYGSCHKKKDSINFTIRMPYAGPACVYIKRVYFYDYTGVFRRKSVTDSHMNIAVLPYIEDGSIYMEYAASAAEASQDLYVNRSGNSVDDIRQIREYQTGDSYRHIHWNLSAKTGSLLVKEFSQETDIEVNVFAKVFIDDLYDYKKMGDFYDKLANETMWLINDKSIINLLWYDYEYDTFIKHRVNNRKDCEDVLYALFLYHEKCRVNNKKTGINKELPSAYKEGNIVVVDTSLKVSVNGSIKV